MTNKPSEQIREIWMEMKELKRLTGGGWYESDVSQLKYDKLLNKYKDVEILFGHESTLDKAIIYYLEQNG